MPPVAALLLDLDGTLVDSEPLHRERYRAWFAQRGWPYDDEVAAQFTGRRADDVFRSVDGPWRGEDPEALLAEIIALEPLRRLPEPVAGAAEAVAWARAHGIPLALVTSAGTAVGRPGARGGRRHRCLRRDRHPRRRRDGQARPGLLRRWPASGSGWLPVRRSPARTHPTGCARPPVPGWGSSSE